MKKTSSVARHQKKGLCRKFVALRDGCNSGCEGVKQWCLNPTCRRLCERNQQNCVTTKKITINEITSGCCVTLKSRIRALRKLKTAVTETTQWRCVMHRSRLCRALAALRDAKSRPGLFMAVSLVLCPRCSHKVIVHVAICRVVLSSIMFRVYWQFMFSFVRLVFCLKTGKKKG